MYVHIHVHMTCTRYLKKNNNFTEVIHTHVNTNPTV